MALPHLPVVRAAIAAEEFVAVGRLDDAERRVGPIEGVGERRFSFGASLETLRRRGNGDGRSHRGIAERSKRLDGAGCRGKRQKAGEQHCRSERSDEHGISSNLIRTERSTALATRITGK